MLLGSSSCDQQTCLRNCSQEKNISPFSRNLFRHLITKTVAPQGNVRLLFLICFSCSSEKFFSHLNHLKKIYRLKVIVFWDIYCLGCYQFKNSQYILFCHTASLFKITASFCAYSKTIFILALISGIARIIINISV